MRNALSRPLFLALSLVATLTLGCGGGDSSSSLSDNCKTICAMSAALKCPNDKPAMCQSMCEQQASADPKCKTQWEALISCSAARPASDWECDDDMESHLKETACQNETAAAIGCVLGS
jgi:hypothetical protein